MVGHQAASICDRVSLHPDVDKTGADVRIEGLVLGEPVGQTRRTEPVVKDSLRVMVISFFWG